MSSYKVGDVASLFPVPKAVNSDQSLFSEESCKRLKQNAKKSSRKRFQKGGAKSNDSVTSVFENKNNEKSVSPDELVKTGSKKRKRINLNSSEDIELTNSNQRIIQKRKKVENTKNEVRMENKLSEVEPAVFKSNKKKKKQHKMAIKSGEPAKKNISNKFNENKNKESYNDCKESNKSSEDLTNIREKKSKEKNEVRMENKLSKVEPAVFKTNKKRKKQHKRAMKSGEPTKENISNKFNENKNNESYNDCEESNKSSEDLTNIRETKSKEKDELLRTLFVGNLPLSVNRKMLQKLFCPFGPLKTVRVRGAIPCKINIPKRIAEFTNKYHESVQSHKGFVVFKDRESAEKALALNGTLLNNHHIVVDFATNAGEKKIYNDKHSIFIGNLPFDVADETVWSAFEECGNIQAVRIIRDRNSGVGKGFGYILFKDNESKQKALALGKLEISGRNIRIKPIDSNTQKKRGSRESFKAIRKNISFKRFKDNKAKKSVKKLMKKGRRLHHNKQIARMLGEKLAK